MEKRVVLIYPYFYEMDPVEKLFQPLGIAYLASQLKVLDVKTDIVDCTFSTFDEAVETIVSMNPAIIGISIMISFSRSAFQLVEVLRRKLPEALFVCGGPLPTLYPEHFSKDFDVVFRGEGDIIFPAFCKNYMQSLEDSADQKTKSTDQKTKPTEQRMNDGNQKADSFEQKPTNEFINDINPEDYPGIFMKRNGKIYSSEIIHHDEEILQGLPIPYREGRHNELYQEFWGRTQNVKPAMIMITRGCPFNCDFCSKPVWGNIFRKPSLDKIFQEIEEIIALGYDQLWIADDSFTLDPEFLASFCTEKIRRNLKISWTCLSRTNGLDEVIVSLMKKAGCVKAYFGLETGSNEVLALMNKHTTVEDGIAAVRLFESIGIGTGGFFIVGYPGETEETIKKTFDLALSLPLDEIFFNIPLPLPGSGLFDRVIGINTEQDWSKASETRFVYKSDFNEDWLRENIEAAMNEFNLRKVKMIK
ncbi:MAG: radical SAM protein [Eubacteriales bacterium]